MITGLIALLVCQLVGELVARSLDLPVPGPVVGMVVLFLVLQLRRPPMDSGLIRGAQVLLRHLSLLYIPAGVGVVAYLAVLRDSAAPVAVGLVVSWAAGLLVTAGAAAATLRVLARARRVR